MKELLKKIAEAVENGEEEETVELTQKALDQGIDPLSIIQDAFSAGVTECGEKYSKGIFFLPELMLTGESMKAGLELVLPKLKDAAAGDFAGKVLMGAVEGDVHDIGKNICLSMLLANGFEIVDAGIDVSADKFVELVNKHQPEIVGLGSYMSTTLPALAESMEAIRKSGFSGKIFAGGVATNKRWADEIGADGHAEDAWGCVKLCKSAVAGG
ncbi:MAG: cobalamin-dependent protein [Desulfopila sp.]|jgi:5-methyltetrahydrofolate--homocysteine methyltransferase|nr:cobalamin-dependent protein [Desulfopila sp.]